MLFLHAGMFAEFERNPIIHASGEATTPRSSAALALFARQLRYGKRPDDEGRMAATRTPPTPPRPTGETHKEPRADGPGLLDVT
jgi:hypothetical protein